MSKFHPTALNRLGGFRQRMRRKVSRGFTLAEVMIATMVFTMGILGVYAMMIKSYELVTLARHRDNARAYLQSFSDEFLRLQTTDLISGSPVTRRLFCTPDVGGTGGDGLRWTDTSGVTLSSDYGASLPVKLGETTSTMVAARVTRLVRYLDSTGTPSVTNTATAAGWMLQGTFTITYNVNGKPYSQSITVARSVR